MFITINESWFPGDTHAPDDHSDAWTAGIHIHKADGKTHWNAIEFYGATKELAEARRNQVLTSLAFMNGKALEFYDGMDNDNKFVPTTFSYVTTKE